MYQKEAVDDVAEVIISKGKGAVHLIFVWVGGWGAAVLIRFYGPVLLEVPCVSYIYICSFFG